MEWKSRRIRQTSSSRPSKWVPICYLYRFIEPILISGQQWAEIFCCLNHNFSKSPFLKHFWAQNSAISMGNIRTAVVSLVDTRVVLIFKKLKQKTEAEFWVQKIFIEAFLFFVRWSMMIFYAIQTAKTLIFRG